MFYMQSSNLWQLLNIAWPTPLSTLPRNISQLLDLISIYVCIICLYVTRLYKCITKIKFIIIIIIIIYINKVQCKSVCESVCSTLETLFLKLFAKFFFHLLEQVLGSVLVKSEFKYLN